jgi:sugar diacid utilization regulator
VAGLAATFVRAETPLAERFADYGTGAVELLGEAARGTTETIRVPTRDGSLRARPVVAAGRTLGLLVLEVASTSTDSTNALMERAATALAMAFTAERSAREAAVRAQDSLLVGLVTGTASGRDEVRRQARLAGLDPTRPYCVLVAHPLDGLGDLRSHIERAPWPDGTVVGEHGFRTLVLAPVDDPEQLVAMWPEPLAASATVAVAGPADTADQLAVRYSEAEQTARVMVALGRAGTAATSTGLGIYRVLLSRTAAHEVDLLVRQALGPLLLEEEHKTVPLVETLEMYLRHHQRHALAANALNVHVNTLYQRLATIDRLLGPGWREPDRALDLQVVLKLRSSVRLLGQAEG